MDAKRKVSPHVPDFVREFVHDVARYKKCPDGNAGVQLVMAALNDLDVITTLAPYLQRGYTRGNRAWLGHRDHNELLHLVSPAGLVLERVHMRFTQPDWESVGVFGFALGHGVSHAAAALLRMAYDNQRIVETIVPGWVPTSPYALREVDRTWAGGLTS